MNKYLTLAKELKKELNIRFKVIPIVVDPFRTVFKNLKNRPEELENKARIETIWDRLEYWEESRRFDETCRDSEFGERSPDNDNGKNL